MRDDDHNRQINRAFSAQAESFSASVAANAAAPLDALLELAAPRTGERWLEAACGPGIVSRRLAPLVGCVEGIDLTPAMIELARREAEAASVANLRFTVGDATASGLADSSFDGAVTRFSVHHVAVPVRLVGELARVVRPGGRVVVLDHVADDDASARAFAQEIERLRDPSHWANLTEAELRGLGAAVGLELEQQRSLPLTLDFEDWLRRGSSEQAAHELVRRAVAQRPDGTDCFAIRGDRDRRTLTLRLWLGRWRRP